MDSVLKPYAAGQVARYTSYPTAKEFSPRVGQNEVLRWLTCVGADEHLSLYIHIPFCQRLCWYCACATSAPNGYERVAEYVQTLKSEIATWANALDDRGQVARIHFGGGSPNMLSPADFAAIMGHIRSHFNVRSDIEIDIELDPRSLTEAFIETMSDVGVTRASLGVQTLAPAVQDGINRIQPRKQISRVVSLLRKNGIQNINFDLMYGLPQQTTTDIAEAANYAAMIGINRLAVFGYAHVPWFVTRQRIIDERALPDLDGRYEQVLTADKVLKDHGYKPVGFDHYALSDDPIVKARDNGTLRRNFQGYTDDDCQTLIGMGESSISSFREGYVQNQKNRRDWRTAIAGRRIPTARGYALSVEDRVRADIIELLLCYREVDIATVCSVYDHSVDALRYCLDHLEPLRTDGLCDINGTLVTIPEDRKYFARQVAAKFDAFAADARQHAIAV